MFCGKCDIIGLLVESVGKYRPNLFLGRVDQPVGTGFSLGVPTATSEEEIAEDFVKFFKNWQQIFGIKNFKIYVTGESYAGRYVPYISAAFLDQNDTEHFNLKGELYFTKVIFNFGPVLIVLSRCTGI